MATTFNDLFLLSRFGMRYGLPAMSPRIQALVTQFVEELTAAIQEEGAAAFKAAIAGGAGEAGARRRPVSRAGSGRTSSQARRKGAKRDPKELEKLTNTLATFIKRKPGQRIEQIGKELGTATKDLALPVKKLLGAKKISTRGQRRATTYYPR